MTNPTPTLRILGIDPGLNTTGYAVVDCGTGRPQLVEAGVVRGGRSADLGARLRELHEVVREIVVQYQPQALAIEELYSHYERPRTAILMGHARGVICLAAALSDLAVCSYSATQVKKLLTGSGRAPKSQVQNAICREFGLVKPPEPPDVADAMAIALCHHFLRRESSLVSRSHSGQALDNRQGTVS